MKNQASFAPPCLALGGRALPESLSEARLPPDHSQSTFPTIIQFNQKLSFSYLPLSLPVGTYTCKFCLI